MFKGRDGAHILSHTAGLGGGGTLGIPWCVGIGWSWCDLSTGVCFCLQWEKLQMAPSERRKIVCSVTFHIIAITCVVWSLYVLIDRTAEEIKTGQATGTPSTSHLSFSL